MNKSYKFIIDAVRIHTNIQTNILLENLSHTKKPKFEYLQHVFDNPFLNESNKDDFLQAFCQIQKIYYQLLHIQQMLLMNDSKIQNTNDLLSNNLDRHDTKHVICIYQQKKCFLFSMNDLIKMIQISIGYSPNFQHNPLVCKNPYNNVEFNKSTMYRIYFWIKKHRIIMPRLVESLFRCEFDIEMFGINYSTQVLEYYVKYFVQNTSVNGLFFHVKNMLEIYNEYIVTENQINISSFVSKSLLVEKVKHILVFYLLYKYSNDENISDANYYHMELLLKSFIKKNPIFERKKLMASSKYHICLAP